MPKYLRNLALTFESPDPGEFMWIIREGPVGGTDYPFEVEAAEEPYDTFEQAMRAGYDKLATLTYGDRERGPQVDFDESDADIPPERQEYRGHLIEIFAKRLPLGTYRSYARVYAGLDPAGGWTSPAVPSPAGGFVDLRDAIETALTTAEMVIDGQPPDQSDLPEGGPVRPDRGTGV